eukprot:ANDGO_02076.mRNA.1 hypothetical protein
MGVWAVLRGSEAVFELEDPKVTIGRAEECDLMLPESRSVSSLHARIENVTLSQGSSPKKHVLRENPDDYSRKSASHGKRTDGNATAGASAAADGRSPMVMIYDLGSRNGTFVNDIRIQNSSSHLFNGDYIRFGYDKHSFRFEVKDHSGRWQSEATETAPMGAVVQRVHSKGSSNNTHGSVNDRTAVTGGGGAEDDNTIQILHSRAGKQHSGGRDQPSSSSSSSSSLPLSAKGSQSTGSSSPLPKRQSIKEQIKATLPTQTMEVDKDEIAFIGARGRTTERLMQAEIEKARLETELRILKEQHAQSRLSAKPTAEGPANKKKDRYHYDDGFEEDVNENIGQEQQREQQQVVMVEEEPELNGEEGSHGHSRLHDDLDNDDGELDVETPFVGTRSIGNRFNPAPFVKSKRQAKGHSKGKVGFRESSLQPAAEEDLDRNSSDVETPPSRTVRKSAKTRDFMMPSATNDMLAEIDGSQDVETFPVLTPEGPKRKEEGKPESSKHDWDHQLSSLRIVREDLHDVVCAVAERIHLDLPHGLQKEDTDDPMDSIVRSLQLLSESLKTYKEYALDVQRHDTDVQTTGGELALLDQIQQAVSTMTATVAAVQSQIGDLVYGKRPESLSLAGPVMIDLIPAIQQGCPPRANQSVAKAIMESSLMSLQSDAANREPSFLSEQNASLRSLAFSLATQLDAERRLFFGTDSHALDVFAEQAKENQFIRMQVDELQKRHSLVTRSSAEFQSRYEALKAENKSLIHSMDASAQRFEQDLLQRDDHLQATAAEVSRWLEAVNGSDSSDTASEDKAKQWAVQFLAKQIQAKQGEILEMRRQLQDCRVETSTLQAAVQKMTSLIKQYQNNPEYGDLIQLRNEVEMLRQAGSHEKVAHLEQIASEAQTMWGKWEHFACTIRDESVCALSELQKQLDDIKARLPAQAFPADLPSPTATLQSSALKPSAKKPSAPPPPSEFQFSVDYSQWPSMRR